MRIDTTAQTATNALFGGEPAAEGDFLALVAALVGGSAEDGEDGVLLPGSPLLETTIDEHGEMPDGSPIEQDDETLETAAPGLWYVSGALAALLARPAVLTDTSPLTLAHEGTDDADATLGEPVTATGTADEAALLDTLPDGAAEASALEALFDESAAADTTDLLTEAGAADDATDGDGASNVAPRAAATADPDGDFEDGSVREPATPRTAAPARAEAPAEPRAASRAEVALDGDPLRTDETTGPSGGSRERVTSLATSSAISRVLDALDQLERMPPPRQVVLELGDLRVRMGIEDGAVRLQVLGEDRGQGRELLRAAEDALRERGFDLAGEQRDGREGRPGDQQRPDLAPPRPRPGPGTARVSRPSDLPTGAATRAAIHL